MTKEPNKALEKHFVNEYIHNISIVECVAIDIGIEESKFIEIIERASASQVRIITDKLWELYKLDDKKIYNSYEIENAIDTIRRLRRNPSLMGLTRDGMRLRFEHVLPPLRKKTYC